MAPRHLDDAPAPVRLPESPHERADREWLTLLTGTADGALTTTAIPQVPTAPIPALPPRTPDDAHDPWAKYLDWQPEPAGPEAPGPGPRVSLGGSAAAAFAAALAGVVLGVALNEPVRALGAVLADLARDLTGGT